MQPSTMRANQGFAIRVIGFSVDDMGRDWLDAEFLLPSCKPTQPAPVIMTPPPAAAAPPTPRDLPSAPPQGSFRNGMLTVTADNSMLLDVLNLVRRLTGATFELPPAGLTERVFAHFGPAPPR